MGFLAHLAGLARGVKPAGAARLSLPSRFADAGATAAPFGEISEETRAPRAAPSVRPTQDDTTQGIETTTTSLRAWGPEERRDEPAITMGDRFVPPPRRAAPRPDGPSAPVAVAPAAPLHPRSPVSDASPAEGQAQARVPSLSQPLAAQHEPLIQPLSHLPARHLAPAAPPLSEAAVAGRTRPARDERPVIHVTIDRLDVRAPVAPKAPAERRRPRSLSSQSLADYLRGGAGGGQR